MPFFHYKARDRKGELVTGSIEAADESATEAAIDRMGLIPIKVVPARKPKEKKDGAGGLKGLFETAPKQSDLIPFSRQLATLFNAGIPLTKALSTLEVQASNPAFASVVRKIREDIEGGASFSAALSKHPRVFTELYSNMVAAGEAGGILDLVLERLALMYEKHAENKSKVRSATLYPKIVLAAIAIAVMVLMNFVVPKFAKLYAQFNVALPLPTRALIFLSNAFAAYWYVPVVAAVAGFFLLRAYISTEKGRYNRDFVVLKIPIFGAIIQKSVISRFSRVLGALYKSGMPILSALDIASRAIENRVIAGEVRKVKEEIGKGKPLFEPMAASPHFPPLVTQMVAVGEETGNLDVMLEKVSQYYDQEIDSAIKNLTTTLEPILLGVIFAVVLFLALAIFLPMWDILKIVRR